MKPDTIKKQQTSWHRLLARLLELVLSPLNIEVEPNVSVMTEPPEADILLLRRKTAQWTKAQQALLPDGIRDNNASHVLIEFKYTQSFNEDALQQSLTYDYLYKKAKQLLEKELQTVVLSAKTPRADTLKRLGYYNTSFSGVYQSDIPIFKKVLLLSLNDLSDEPHNAWVKCFSTKKKAKQQAMERLKTVDFISVNEELRCFIVGLRKIWSILLKGDTQMKMKFTPEEVTEFGKEFGDIWLAGLKPQERLAGLKPQERLAGLKATEIDELENYIKQLKKRKR